MQMPMPQCNGLASEGAAYVSFPGVLTCERCGKELAELGGALFIVVEL